MTDTTTFTDLGVEAGLADALKSKGIVHPFPIQELTLPMALKGADLIGQARTGTGKTLAFGLPLLQRVDPNLKKTQAVVIVPTRELCLQVADDLTVGAERGVTSIAIYGGVGYEEQIEALTGGVHVVIGTPGRTLDHLGRRNLDLSNVHTVVLDEADEMLDMGFLPDVERLLTSVPDERQTLLFSATMPVEIVKLARRFMHQPTFMRAESQESQIASTVEQHFLLVHRMDKPRVLARLLQSPGRGGAFVFTRTKNMADRLVRELEDLRVSAIAVHGDLRQSTREKNLDRFRAGKADVLVATEVAARGLDVDNVTHVFNYDCPDDEKMYLHRIGRTARAGNQGVAVTFAEFNEVDRLNVIRKAVQADGDVAEVFSTSAELTERFDLPEETPWDHLVRTSRGSANGSGSGGGGGKQRRSSSSDGRNQSRREQDGSRPASRDRRPRPKDEPRERPKEQPKAQPERQTASASTSSDDGGGRVRTRTRTRTRARTSDRQSDSRDTSTRADRGSTSGDTKGGDTKGGDTRAEPSRSSEGGGGNRRRRNRGGGGSTSASNGNGDRATGGRDGGRGNRGRGDQDTSNGDGGNRGRGGARTTRRGEQARGEGTPRPRRRVQVDHLP